MMLTDLDKEVVKIEWILVQQYAASIAYNFRNTTKNCRYRVECYFISDGLVQVYETGNNKESKKYGVCSKRWKVFEDRVPNGANIKCTI
jgi:hypothetical protein